jgi:hypothetical protein
MWASALVALGSFFAAYWVGWLFLSWTFLHKYDETDLGLQVWHRGRARARAGARAAAAAPRAAAARRCGPLRTARRRRPNAAPAAAAPASSQALWSCTFAFSCNLLLLVVYEVVGVIEPGCGGRGGMGLGGGGLGGGGGGLGGWVGGGGGRGGSGAQERPLHAGTRPQQAGD